MATSVVEFLQSRLFTEGTVLLLEEDDDVGAPPPAPPTVDAQTRQDRRIMENAARVALLVARSFVRGVEGEDQNQLSSGIQLADYFVELEERDVAAVDVEEEDAPEEIIHKIILLGVQEISPILHLPSRGGEDRQQQQQYQGTQMQILGRLLYCLFSRARFPGGDIVLPAAFSFSKGDSSVGNSATDSSTLNNFDDLFGQRSSRRMRTTESSVFTELIGSKALPVSICRFLSDIIDTGRGGRSDSYFGSFQEVIQDLEQMISHPSVLLHDSSLQQMGHPSFGGVHCGRQEEALSILGIANRLEYSLDEESNNNSDESERSEPVGLEAVFIAGTAGCGKTHLARAITETLLSSGWIVIRAKFDQRRAHASGGIISSMFDQAIANVVNLRDGGKPADVAYSEQVSKSILDSIGREGLCGLKSWLPSLSLLFTDIEGGEETDNASMLIYSMSKILEAILEPGRFMIMICCDDLQFSDDKTISLLSEILISLGGVQKINRRCLFMGLFRDDEGYESGPFDIQYSHLQMSRYLNTTEIKLPSLSKGDIADMIIAVLKLPRRFVVDLADVVFKKTAGHALFVVEFLNKLLQDSIITYDFEKHCYSWDRDQIDFVSTSENVAEFIASNLKTIPPESQRSLQILSCFGNQTDQSLLQVIEKFQDGIISSLEQFVERGILDRAGPIVIFTHDLILAAVYESMSIEERQLLHYGLGKHIGNVASSSSPSSMGIECGMGHMELNDSIFAGIHLTSPLISLACDQINLAMNYIGNISDEDERMTFATWNHLSGQKMVHLSDFSAAFYYFMSGVSFLSEDSWQTNRKLCIDLNLDAAAAALAIGKHDSVRKLSKNVPEHHVPLRECLELQFIFLRSMLLTYQCEEAISLCMEIFRHIGIALPDSVTDEVALDAKSSADQLACSHTNDAVVNLCGTFSDGSDHHQVIKIIYVYLEVSWTVDGPLFPTMVYEGVKYSLLHGVCQESAGIFALYAMFKITMDGDYGSAKKWANITRAVVKEYQTKNEVKISAQLRALIYLEYLVEIYWTPLRDIGTRLLTYSHECKKMSDNDLQYLCRVDGLLIKAQGGDTLSIITHEFAALVSLSKVKGWPLEVIKYGLHDSLLLAELTGISEEEFLSPFGFSCVDDLQLEFGKDQYLLYRYQVYSSLRAYWKGDFVSAEDYFCGASSNPSNPASKFTTIFLNFPLVFFGGLISFGLYRTFGGEERLQRGRNMLAEIEAWAQNSMTVHGNNMLLLRAESSFSVNGPSDEAEQLYRASIKAAQDHGKIHDLAISYELLGKYYDAQGRAEKSCACFNSACVYYNQWGATGVAERLRCNHNLDVPSLTSIASQTGHSKQKRHFE